MPRITVGEKALAHLSRGLYRSPASALRELVSNAWDANANLVWIDTNYPNFHQISVQDNGKGFTREEFERLMEGGIGNSSKRPSITQLIHDRPVIGRLGIGLLGIAQICGEFTVVSKTREGEGFRARVRLYDLLRERVDEEDQELIETDEQERITEVDIGEYEFEDFVPASTNYGTILITTDVHPTFTRSFQKSLQYEKFKEPIRDWGRNLKILSGVRSLQELGDYWRLLWELSASCPVPYLDENALPNQLIHEKQQKLEEFDFRVVLDGINLYKPVYLQGNPGGYTTFKIEPQTRKVYGRELRFQGYIAVQEGTQLKPDELRGILIRVKNVGIGYYDPSMLDYRINEGPRSRWLTGEIFIEEGLEDALNIDRDSFNRFHPEFRTLQEYVHLVLQKNVFPRVYEQIEVRSTARATSKSKLRAEHLKTIISQAVDAPVEIQSDIKKDISDQALEIAVTDTEDKQVTYAAIPQVAVEEKDKKLEVTLPANEALKTKKSHQQLAAAILAIFEVAVQENTPDKQRKVFTDMLLKLLARW